MKLSERERIRQVEAVLDGGKRIHFPFCNHFHSKPAEDCSMCGKYIITERTTGDELINLLKEIQEYARSG